MALCALCAVLHFGGIVPLVCVSGLLWEPADPCHLVGGYLLAFEAQGVPWYALLWLVHIWSCYGFCCGVRGLFALMAALFPVFVEVSAVG